MTTKLKELQTLMKIFWYLVLGICLVFASYVYFVNKTVHNVANRQKAEVEISKLTSELGELEFKSISMRNKISQEYAYSLGFRDVKNQQYVSRKVEHGELSLRTTR